MDFSQTPEWRGGIETRLNACLIAFSTLFMGMRLYVRTFMTKALGWDDLIAGIAYVLIMVQSSLDLRLVSYGSGAKIEYVGRHPEIVAEFFKSLTIQTIIYIWPSAS